MYDFNNILDLMRSGVSAEDIAKAFSDELNNAVEVVEAEAINESDFREVCSDAASSINDAIDDYIVINKMNVDAADLEVDADFIADAVEFFVKTYAELAPYIKTLKKEKASNPTPVKENKVKDDDFENVMGKFLHELGL